MKNAFLFHDVLKFYVWEGAVRTGFVGFYQRKVWSQTVLSNVIFSPRKPIGMNKSLVSVFVWAATKWRSYNNLRKINFVVVEELNMQEWSDYWSPLTPLWRSLWSLKHFLPCLGLVGLCNVEWWISWHVGKKSLLALKGMHYGSIFYWV